MAAELQVAVVGGLGMMASPMARHFSPGGPVRVVRVHDRGRPGADRDRRRAAWRAHGAALVPTIAELCGPDLDGVIACCGKNGDDLPLIAALTAELAARGKPNAFLCHMSTVSAGFAAAATEFCAQKQVQYVNYPLTGGVAGAEAGTMLILASGAPTLFSRLEPGLRCIGKPRYYGASPRAGAEVKLIGHLMVFGGLIGISSALAVHAECFRGGQIGGDEQSEFFDFLNAGAGGTRQWDLIAHNGVRHGRWEDPFKARYAVVDAIYLAELCVERAVARMTVQTVMSLAFAFSYLLNQVGEELATHAIVREMVAARASALDAFVRQWLDPGAAPSVWIQRCIDSLPKSIADSVALGVDVTAFSRPAS